MFAKKRERWNWIHFSFTWLKIILHFIQYNQRIRRFPWGMLCQLKSICVALENKEKKRERARHDLVMKWYDPVMPYKNVCDWSNAWKMRNLINIDILTRARLCDALGALFALHKYHHTANCLKVLHICSNSKCMT